jgi:hypothetical protein
VFLLLRGATQGGEGGIEVFLLLRDTTQGGEGGIEVFLLLRDTTHCSASGPLLFSKGLLQNISATFALRPSPFALRRLPLAIRLSSFVIQKKSPPAFAGGLSKLGFDLWIIC